MTVDPSSDLQHFRNLFPITAKCIYFNHAGTGPMSIPARKAIEKCLGTYSYQAEFYPDEYFALVRTARAKVASLLNADASEIAFTHNTSEGIYIALMNLSLEPGDTLLVMNEVFPAVRYVVEHNFPHVDKKYVDFSGRDPVEVVRSNLQKGLKAVVVDYVQFLSGETIDLKELGRFTREQNIFLVVDGIQGVGALDFDAGDVNVDFMACGAAKWLLGPSGAGFLYVNKRNFDHLGTQHTGWLGADWKDFGDFTSDLPLFKDARKYEMGTRNVIGIQALSANIDILLEYGMHAVHSRIVDLKSRLRGFFEDSNYAIMTPGQVLQSGIISMRMGNDMEELYAYLKRSKIIVSLRNGYFRFSPHFYNTEAEVNAVIDALSRFSG